MIQSSDPKHPTKISTDPKLPGTWIWDGMAYRLIDPTPLTREQRIDRIKNLPYDHDMYYWMSKLL